MTASFSQHIEALRLNFLQELGQIAQAKDVEQLKVKYLGKKGPVQELLLRLREAPSADRPHLGKLVNDLKEELASHCENSLARVQEEEMARRFEQEAVDSSLPGRRRFLGRLHPVTKMLQRTIDIFAEMGFAVRLGPNLDNDYYNFEGLNFPLGHPAREMQDTLYVSMDALLRTHTSNVQVHTMEKEKPPIRAISPGRCFRNETISARSHVFFHQIEGFYIDKGVSFADLLSTMEEFWQKLLGRGVQTRFRPSYFPFVEPGLEVDVACTSCKGKGCKLCKHTGWLEVCGAGMIHPKVLQRSHIDPEEFSGYAWGLGIERLAILIHQIPDIRLFSENDARFLKQFV